MTFPKTVTAITTNSFIQRLLSLETRFFKITRDGKIIEDSGHQLREKLVMLPGSFNPLHRGHVALLKAASALHPDTEPVFELSCSNADKGLLGQAEVIRRLQQFRGGELGDWSVIATVQMPTFVSKSLVFPNTAFVLGIDTAVRVVMPKYYGNSEENMISELSGIGTRGGKFIVAGRYDATTQRFISDMQVPPRLSGLFEFLPSFRLDISSTELRAKPTIKSSL